MGSRSCGSFPNFSPVNEVRLYSGLTPLPSANVLIDAGSRKLMNDQLGSIINSIIAEYKVNTTLRQNCKVFLILLYISISCNSILFFVTRCYDLGSTRSLHQIKDLIVWKVFLSVEVCLIVTECSGLNFNCLIVSASVLRSKTNPALHNYYKLV